MTAPRPKQPVCRCGRYPFPHRFADYCKCYAQSIGEDAVILFNEAQHKRDLARAYLCKQALNYGSGK